MEILVIESVAFHGFGQFAPVLLGGDVDAGGVEEVADLVCGGLPDLVEVLFEVFPGGVLGFLETLEALVAFLSQGMRGAQRVENRGVEVHVGEIQALFRAVEDFGFRQETVQVHRAQADRVGHVVAALDGRH